MSRQWRAVEAITDAARRDDAVKAIFLKGSLASGADDELSDVDIYCLVEQADLSSFLARRFDILSKYARVLYQSESDFVGPQIVAVFADGLHLDLYTVTPARFPAVGAIRSLYDPDNRLPVLCAAMSDHSISWHQTHRHFAEFSFTLLEFHAAWHRGDVLWSARLASHLAGDLGIVLRSLYDPASGQLGTKRLEAQLPVGVLAQMRAAVAAFGGGGALGAVVDLCHLMRSAVGELEGRWEQQADWGLFDYMENALIQSLLRR